MNSMRSLAQYVVREASQYGNVAPMKLQKLLYYVKAWGLVAGHKTVPLSFEKWDYGPVNQSVYHGYRSYGSEAIASEHSAPPSGWSEQARAVADMVITSYAPLSALTLSVLIHHEAPWQQTPKNEIIPESTIRSYYQTQRFAKNFPFDPENGPFYPVASNLSYAYVLDMTDEEAQKATAYPSYNAYRHHLHEAGKHIDRTVDRFKALASE